MGASESIRKCSGQRGQKYWTESELFAADYGDWKLVAIKVQEHSNSYGGEAATLDF
jgi:hypothetical protein